MADLAARLAALSPDQRALFELRLRAKTKTSSAIPRLEGRTTYPLTFAQERLWFLEQWSPGNAAYNIPLVLHVTGPLDVSKLRDSIRAVAARHEALRASIRIESGYPIQLVSAEIDLELAVERVRGWDDVAAIAEREVRRPFDLTTPPLIRLRLLRVTDREHWLLATIHHMIADGWSLSVFVRELAALYERRPLKPLSIQYGDFAVWQREWLQGSELEEQRDYWKRQLAGLSALELPADYIRPPVATNDGAAVGFEIDTLLHDAIDGMARRQHVTKYMVLLAGFAALLHRYTGQEDLALGMPVANRNHIDTEPLIGFFVNTLIVRIDVRGNPTFRQLLDRVAQATIAAFAHQDVPFEKVVEELQPQREISRQPLIQVLVQLQNMPTPSATMIDIEITPHANTAAFTRFDLEVHLEEGADELRGRLQYRRDLWNAETMERLARHYIRVLEGATTEPDGHVADLPLLSAHERQELLVEWNRTATAYPRDRSLPQLFEEQVALAPNAVAVVFNDCSLTYAELNNRANQVAHCLQEHGAGPETRIALCVERSLEMVVAIIAITKTGASYVPFDPDFPTDRFAFMLDDTEPALVLTQERFRDRFSRPVVCLDADRARIADYSTTNPEPLAGPESLAYLMYTSGSTGVPKAVAVPHRAVVRLVNNNTYAELGPHEVVLQLASISFDASTFEIWAPLLNGGRLIVFPPFTPSLEELGRIIGEQRVTTLWLTAGLFHQVMEHPHAGFRSLRQLLTGGEVVSPAHARKALRVLPDCQLINAYGPTENTTFTCCHTLRSAEELGATVPIGRPIANTRVYVLDERGQPVPVGVPGELYIGGDGLARGYWRRPSLTAERFVASPWDPDGRLYRTGDRVKWRADGVLEFLGRLDRQVKIRGFRVELGEVETVLREHPSVHRSVVVARDAPAGEQQLIAYIVGPTATAAAVRAYLETRLPAYLIPSHIVVVAQLPLTPNGKVDTAALPAPPVTAGRQPPRTPWEELVAAMWSELLGVADLDREAHFFELGGHSLLAMRVLTRVQQVAGVDLPVRTLFEAPRVAAFAAQVEAALAAPGPPMSAIASRSDRTRAPLSFAQRRFWFLEQLRPANPAYHIPLTLRLTGPLDAERLRAALQAVVARHEPLRTHLVPDADEPVQVIAASLAVELPIVAVADDDAAQQIVEAEARRCFDLTQAPLWRARLLRRHAHEHWLVLTLHHLIADGWSLGVLLRELAACYEGTPLDPLPIHYGDFAAWQRQEGHADRLAASLAYWRRQLTAAPVLHIPTDRPRPAVVSNRGAGHRFAIEAALLTQLTAVSRAHGATLYMTLLAGFIALLARYTGQQDLIVGSPIAARRRAELEPLIGLFVNTLILRTDLHGAPTFRELVGRVRDVTLHAYAHQDVPFETLVEELHPARDLSRHPLVQVFFQLQNLPSTVSRMSDLAVSIVADDSRVTRFDLEVHLTEANGRVEGCVQYSTDLWNAATIERLVTHFVRLLEIVAADPNVSVADVFLLSKAEHQQILVDWNRTATEYPRERTVQELFEQQVRLHPHRPAVICGAQTWSYQELNRKANQLAHRLRACGVHRDVPVAVCLERSVELIVALVAVVKAGGAYVPLDPSFPEQRLQWLRDDSQALFTLTHTEWPEVDGESEENPILENSPDDLVYVIYTSGSTGEPKGVAVQQRGLVNLLSWHQQEYEIIPDDRATQLASPAFDAMGWEIWPYLTAGASVHIVPENARLQTQRLIPWLAQHGITVSFLPTPLAENVLENLKTARLPLRLLLTGGDRLHQGRAVPFRLTNQYGPTESTVVATWSDVCAEAGPPPIGRPIANTRVYVLDERGQPVPVGVPGELYIGGDGLARGYWRRPSLTAERFVASPWDPDGRLYRTGDRVKWRADGVLEFLGRLDRQVKIRGFRVELGEVETVLREHPSVHRSVVVARDAPAGEQQLIAYIVGPTATAAAVRAYLETRLPAYLIPSHIVVVAQLPLTPNGKVDTAALPAPPVTAGRQPPRTPWEELVAAMWSELLGVADLDREAHFFELGGHSLLAMRVLTRVQQVAGVDLPVRTLFEAPRVAAFAAQVEAALAAPGPPMSAIASRSDRTRAPLSFAQRRFWFLEQLRPANPAYHIPLTLRLTGPLDAERLRAALQAVVARHEPLRTHLVPDADEPVQVIAASLAVELPIVAVADDDAAQQIVEAEARRCFDLTQAPLWRARLLRRHAHEHWLVLTLHHLIADGWSLGVLLRELAACYEGTPLDPLPIHYGDFAAWQRQEGHADRLAASLAYWRRQLTAAPVLHIPTDRPRPAVVSNRGAGHRFAIEAALLTQLTAVSRAHGATLYMTLLAGFIALLARYTGQQDLIVGSPIAARRRAELEPLIGLFVNTLILRTDLHGAPTFRELVGRVRDVTLHAYAHQDVPFETLVEELHPARDLSRHPLVQVFFQLQNLPWEECAMHELRMSMVESRSRATLFDLEMHLAETVGRVEGCVQYNPDLWNAATIEEFSLNYLCLLEGCSTSPETPIIHLPLLSAAQQQQVLVDWNRTATPPYSAERTVHHLFEEQVERTPDANALAFEEQTLTYSELNSRANQLAHHLRERGSRPETQVAVCVERSLEMAIAILGIIKTGAAYVPLDPTYPPDRLAFMLEDADAPLLVTQERYRHRLSQQAGTSNGYPTVVCIDTHWQTIAAQSTANLKPLATPEDLAYVIYTSGSTGRPKGVAVPHRGLRNTVLWHQREYDVGPLDRATLSASPAFDAMVCEFWPYLTAGATVYIIPEELRHQPRRLMTWMAEQGITLSFLPSPLAEIALEQQLPSGLKLRALLTGGDRLTRGRAGLPFRFVNQYGPTESSVWATCCDVEAGTDPPPIGRPIANTRIYVLDEHAQPVPIGVPGELHIGGDGLARGYWRRPQLTAERFVISALDPAGRVYRTGDRVRWRRDGQLEFLGRIDHQVKIRGFRVELGEIEAVLRDHPSVRDVVAFAHDDPRGKRLIAYVVAPDVSAADLRVHLAERVPDYLIPSAFVFMDHMPLNSNGKVDRAQLPTPDAIPETAFIAPGDSIEYQLATIWGKLLRRHPIGVRDNFFDLGGHSILALSLFSEIEKTFGRALPLATLFQAPTIEQLAAVLRQNGWKPAWSSLVPIQPRGSRPPLFCVHGVGGNVLTYRHFARFFGSDQPVYGLQSRGLDGNGRLESIEQMAAHYLSEMRALQPEGPYHIAGMSFGGIVAFEIARQVREQGEQVGLLAILDTGGAKATEVRTTQAIVEKLWFHALKALQQEGKEKLIYIGARVRTLKRKARSRLWQVAYRWWNGIGQPLPRALRDVTEANYLALRDYRPKPFDGTITLFRSEPHRDARDFRWGHLSLRVDIIDTPGDHVTMLSARHAHSVAERVQSCLEGAYARSSSSTAIGS